MMENTCFFIGHRDAPDSLYPALAEQVERHIVGYGVTEFVVGSYGRFDSLAVQAVKDAKKRHQQVTLLLLLPYHPAERSVPLLSGFDGTFYPPGMEAVPKRAAIVRANRYMVEHSKYLIAWAWQAGSNAKKLADYAVRRERRGLIQISLLPVPVRPDQPPHL